MLQNLAQNSTKINCSQIMQNLIYPSQPTVSHRFFCPLEEVHPLSEYQRKCPGISDIEYLRMGVLRVLSDARSGRDFLQKHADHCNLEVKVNHWFKALASDRRLKNLISTNDLIAEGVREIMPDPFASIPELDGFDIYAGDGHYHAAACHDQPVEHADGTFRRVPVGHFFQLNLRSHALRHINLAESGGGRKSEHDTRAVKRAGAIVLRNGAPIGRKVIYAWDRAVIDTNFWNLAKHNHGLYFITLDKDGMIFVDAETREIDFGDDRNMGVIVDEIAYSKTSRCKIRRIVYVDPATGAQYTYLTTEMTLPPGILVLIYKHRWDIEKVFDETKTKCGEKKAWATGEIAKCMQAHFICLTHNLMMMLENVIEEQEGIVNEKEKKRRNDRMNKVEELAEINGGASFVSIAIQRFTQRTWKFIRWLRNHIYRNVPWKQAVGRLSNAYAM